MATAKPRVSYSDKNKALLSQFAHERNISMGEMVDWFIENYDPNAADKNNAEADLKVRNAVMLSRKNSILAGSAVYSPSEQQEIDRAITNSQLSLETIAKEGLLQRARYLNSVATYKSKLDSMSESELKESTFKGVAKHRISQAIEKIMQHNDEQTEKKNKVCLTKGAVFKITNSNRQNINQFFNEYAAMISDHNHKHQLTEADNRKGKNFELKTLLGV